MKVLPRVLESCLEEEEVAPELRVTCSAEPFAPGLAKSWWQNLRGWECFGSKSKWGSACAQISGCVNLLSPCVLQTFSIHLPTYLFQWFGILRMEMLLGLIVEWWACSLTTVLLLKAFISKWSNFNCVWEKKNLQEKLKRLENCQTKGSQGLSQGALDQACVSCSASCILSRAVVPALMNDFIADKGITHRISCHQYVVTGICIWPLSKMFLCWGTLQSSEEGYNAGVVSVCHLLASVPRPFANIFCVHLASFIWN